MKLLCTTIPPFEGYEVYSSDGESARSGYNLWLRSTAEPSGCDALLDIDDTLRDPTHPTQLLAKYDSGDHWQPNDAGLQAIADAVDLTLFQ